MKKWIGISVLVVLTATFVMLANRRPDTGNLEYTKFADFNSFYQFRLAESIKAAARPGNEEKILRFSPDGKKTKYALLYIHGFLASRAEGEYTIDRIAKKYRMNTYYLRLPGHGTNKEDLVSKNYRDFLALADQALHHVQYLGENIVVTGTSTGGLLALWLASRYPDKVKATIIASLFLDFTSPAARVVYYPGGLELTQLLYGKVRKAVMDPKDPRYNYEHYIRHWYVENYYEAFRPLVDLRKIVNNEETMGKIKAPVLLFVYSKDDVASPETMQERFAQLGSPQKKLVEMETGDHILFSKYVVSDKEKIEKEISGFLENTVFP